MLIIETIQKICWFTSQVSWTHLHPMGKGVDLPVLILSNRHGQIYTVWFVDGMVEATWQNMPEPNSFSEIEVWDAR